MLFLNLKVYIVEDLRLSFMDTFECITTRRSIRKYMPIPVENEKLARIFEAAKSAPTAGNLQDFKFILVKDHNKIKQIADASLQQYWIAEAPVVIVVCSDTERLEYFYGVRGTRLYSVQDCAAAIQNILLEATDQGLGSCWVGAFNEAQLARILAIPPHVRAQAIIPIGYPDEVVPSPGHKSMEEMVYLEAYGNKIESMAYQLKNYRFLEGAKTKADKLSETINHEKDTFIKKIIKQFKNKKEK